MLTTWDQRDIAMLALIVATCSAVFVLGGLVWQITLYRLSGARLRVTIAHGAISPLTEALHSAAPGHLLSVDKVDTPKSRMREELIEVVLCKVVNTGRAAISIEHIGIDFGRERWWRRGRRSMVPAAVTAFGGVAVGTHRLDAGESATLIFPLWGCVTYEQRQRGDVRLAAYASPAGRRTVISKRSKRLVLRTGKETLLRDHVVTREERAHRAFWSHTRGTDGQGESGVRWSMLRDRLEAAKSAEDVRDGLNLNGDENGYHIASAAVWEAYNWSAGHQRVWDGY
ncbi:hypothetical protein U3653_26200 [Nocardia sp. CDC186]|uniref:Uncharacterized protein n=1 Tax=Nocardia implantans TaxID=3108168 RepID=A0ABU6B2C2_9NOCA|nr:MULTISPECIES: hypothetical protein [unclassified Nocardia]MBF6195658.1 hypothetical protein [Nocardia beijingensis]MEA3531256.1 hypothetical protein [Nocardia sp. CDC192]MEB3513534.1 hypothetical protein [Nocardia sp. CDC186]